MDPGLAALPCLIDDPEPRLRRVGPGVIATRPVSLVYRRACRLSREARAVITMIVEVMREHAGLIAGTR